VGSGSAAELIKAEWDEASVLPASADWSFSRSNIISLDKLKYEKSIGGFTTLGTGEVAPIVNAPGQIEHEGEESEMTTPSKKICKVDPLFYLLYQTMW